MSPTLDTGVLVSSSFPKHRILSIKRHRSCVWLIACEMERDPFPGRAWIRALPPSIRLSRSLSSLGLPTASYVIAVNKPQLIHEWHSSATSRTEHTSRVNM